MSVAIIFLLFADSQAVKQKLASGKSYTNDLIINRFIWNNKYNSFFFFIMAAQQNLVIYIFAISFLPCFSFSLHNLVPSASYFPGHSSYSKSMPDNLIIYTKSPYGYGNYNLKYQTKLFAKKQAVKTAPTKKNSGGLRFSSPVLFNSFY